MLTEPDILDKCKQVVAIAKQRMEEQYQKESMSFFALSLGSGTNAINQRGNQMPLLTKSNLTKIY